MIEVSKMSKKAQKAYYTSQRATNGFNTGTRTMKTAKNPSRATQKALDRKAVMCYT